MQRKTSFSISSRSASKRSKVGPLLPVCIRTAAGQTEVLVARFSWARGVYALRSRRTNQSES